MEKTILRAVNLTREFPSGGGRIRVLDGINLRVKPGESLAVVGPSGSGKSTLLSLLAGLDSPSAGEVFLEEVSLNGMADEELSRIWGRRIGFIFQSYHLLPTLTAEENVRVPLELAGDPEAGRKSLEWLEKVGLKDRSGHLPVKLSGGEQQRVALARAMAPEPDILFADEPTGNLDSKTGKEMGDLLFSLVKEHGTTLIIVTHESSFAERAQRLVELRDGRIVREK